MHILPSLLACASLGACVAAPKLRPPALTLPPAYAAGDPASGAVTLDCWWLAYNDEQLTDLVERALGQGFTVREAFTRLQEARAIRSGALAQFRLQGSLSVSGEAQRTQQLDGGVDIDIPGLPPSLSGGNNTTKSASVAFPVSWEVDLFGRRAATRRVAAADLDAARFDYEGMRAATAAEIARSLFEARGLATRIDDARASANIQRRLVDLLTQRAGRGLAPRSEVDRVEADLAQAEALEADLTAALDASRRSLLVLVGAGTRSVATLAVTATISTPPAIPAVLPGELLLRRPDVREAGARLRAAIGNVRLDELAFFPRLSLRPSGALSYTAGDFGGLQAIAGVTAGLTAPLFDRERLHAQLGASSARAEGALLAYERTVQTAYSEADQALIRLDADRARIARLETGAAAAERSYTAALRRFELGFSDLQAVLDAERVVRGARSALTAARLEGMQRSVQAFQALGGGWDMSGPDADFRG
ncbi:efflux transporter outer membrane subunit [Sphingopyxis fribergensis]